MPLETPITPDRIAETERLIRPHVRHTPVLRVDLSEFGSEPRPVALKLECLQHSGSFKARGAFANLLTRPIPAHFADGERRFHAMVSRYFARS